MLTFFSKIKLFCLRIHGFLPKRLPYSAETFEDYFNILKDVYGIQDFPSYRQAFATMVMHLPNTASHKSPHYFAKCIRKAISNEVAFEIIDRQRRDRTREQPQSSEAGSSDEPIAEQKA